jgi:hypothetical protein
MRRIIVKFMLATLVAVAVAGGVSRRMIVLASDFTLRVAWEPIGSSHDPCRGVERVGKHLAHVVRFDLYGGLSRGR